MNPPDIEEASLIKPAAPSEIISVSCRTDVPSCYMRPFVKSLEKGFIDVPNPMYPSSVFRVDLSPSVVKVLAWWSKNYKKFIIEWQKEKTILSSFKHYFNFTINGESELESLGVGFGDVLIQLRFLAETFGVHALNVRFDPIVHYRFTDDDPSVVHDNLDDFEEVVKTLAELRIPDLTFSFCVPHPKVVTRMRKRGKVLLIMSRGEKQKTLDSLLAICKENGVVLKSCCEKDLVGYEGVKQATCIDPEKIQRILGRPLKSRAKGKQREQCNCVKARDVGSYKQVCSNSCDYCYANPAEKTCGGKRGREL